jgi:hypothetical protein
MMERRKAPRVKLTWMLQAKVKAYLPARVIDLSATGVLLELDHPLPPKTACSIKIVCESEDVQLPAVIRRCCVGGHGKNEKGQKIVLYHAGLAFENPDPVAIERLREHVSLPAAPPLDRHQNSALADGREAIGQPDDAGGIHIEVDVDSPEVT